MSAIEKARELGIALSDSPEYIELRDARLDIEENEKLHTMIEEYLEKQILLRAFAEGGDRDPEEAVLLVSEIDRLKNQLDDSDLFKRFIVAQDGFTNLLAQVNQEINNCIGYSSEYSDEPDMQQLT